MVSLIPAPLLNPLLFISPFFSPNAMDTAGKIIRRSIHTFLGNYHYFANVVAFLLLPFSMSILASHAFLLSSSVPLLPTTIHARLLTLFQAAGFPSHSRFFNLLSLKLAQTISTAILTLPFTFSFLLIAKASVIRALHKYPSSIIPPSFSSLLPIYAPILVTYACNLFAIMSINAVSFFFIFIAFNSLDAFNLSSSSFFPSFLLFLSAAGAILYSFLLAKAFVVCNLALIVSGMRNNCSGYIAVLKACVLMRGRVLSVALSLAIPFNFALAAVEALFQYRVLRVYHHVSGNYFSFSLAFEGLLIAYLYSILIVLDTITSCLFFKSCTSCCWREQEDGAYHQSIGVAGENERGLILTKTESLTAELP